METMLTCREFVDFLAEYLEGRLSEDQLARFNGHLAACPSCVSYTRSYRTRCGWGRAFSPAWRSQCLATYPRTSCRRSSPPATAGRNAFPGPTSKWV